ncbi:hypothetical protein Pta02_42310 [Planobispora takensis]|uniref:Uncharacterized protein n=1 Tax=Planobispora takensis TaxID=1367882 RepID=A0A8J3T0V5_9ACTN|nr:hypothetical protein Pta02_42310 [Planobispora takensis]
MSNVPRNMGGILTAVTLAALAGWAAPAPAGAGVSSSTGRVTAGQLPADSLAGPFAVDPLAGPFAGSLLDSLVDPQADPFAPESRPLADRLARVAGLEGLSMASAVLSLADAGGVAAAIGFPALPFGPPGRPGLDRVEMLLPTPDLPGLPGAPATRAGFTAGVPSVPRLRDAAGALSTGTVLSLPVPYRTPPEIAVEPAPRVIGPRVPVRSGPGQDSSRPGPRADRPARPARPAPRTPSATTPPPAPALVLPFG